MHFAKSNFDNFVPAFLIFYNIGHMTDTADNKNIKLIDVEGVISSKNPALRKALPQFVINYLKRIIHQEELNEFLQLYGHLKNADFVLAGLKHFKINYSVSGTENIPSAGRYIFVSNHPLGGLDGLVFIYELSKYFKDNLNGIFLPVNKHGAQGKEAARLIDEAYSSDSQILYFPAGLCSRKKGGVIKDLVWQKNFISKAVAHKRDIIPAYFSGRNSDFFYNLANLRNLLRIKMNIEMLYLADELFRQKDKKIRLVFGQRIPWQTFDKSKSPMEWAEWTKEKTYGLYTQLKD